MKILPPGLSFEQALRRGYAGRIECRAYLDWLKTLPCDTCGKAPPSDPSHVNAFGGHSTKAPDWFSLPECRACHENYHRGPAYEDARIKKAAFYLLQAIYEGRLVWVEKT